jgi:hypothetical protein
MSPRFLVAPAVAAGLLLGAPAAAQLRLAWDDCGEFGHQTETFACRTNEGTHSLILSFEAPSGVTEMTGMYGEIHLIFPSSPIPDWWAIGACRPASVLTGDADFTTGPGSCLDYWQGRAQGAIVFDVGGVYDSWLAKVRFVQALPAEERGPLTAGSRYYAMRFTLKNSGTVGADACGGCAVSAVMVPHEILIAQPMGIGDHVLRFGYGFEHPYDGVAVWECAHLYAGGWGFCEPTPALPLTWGRVKSLYR